MDSSTKSNGTLEEVLEEVLQDEGISDHRPLVPVDGPIVDRLRQTVGATKRTSLCSLLPSKFDDSDAGGGEQRRQRRRRLRQNDIPQNNTLVAQMDAMAEKYQYVHLSNTLKLDTRLLVPFYAFVFYQNWKMDLTAKRMVRDSIRYNDEIQCAAARIVRALRNISSFTNAGGEYDSMHIRRGDYGRIARYRAVVLSAEEVYENSKDELRPGGTLYIATDEKNKTYFQLLHDNYDVYYLEDFLHLLPDKFVNALETYGGMLDQLVASKGRVFFGTFTSTVTSFINRMRGYHSTREQWDGYENGTVPSYYLTKDRKFLLRHFVPPLKEYVFGENAMGWYGF